MIFNLKPKYYGYTYLLLIPFYAIIFYFNPETIATFIEETNIQINRTFIECIYFSTVTITTLGYGDILPINDLGKIIASTESILGITVIGLFLNSLSSKQNKIEKDNDTEREKKQYFNTQGIKIKNNFKLLNLYIETFKENVLELTIDKVTSDSIYNKNFSFSELRLEKKSKLTKDLPIIIDYTKALEKIVNEFSDFIKNTDLELFPEINDNILLFIKETNTRMSTKEYGSKLSLDLMNDENNEIVNYVKNYTNNSKSIIPEKMKIYINLVKQIKLLINLLETINKNVNSIAKC